MTELSRRELLERAAYTAGLAGAAAILPADLLLQEAAAAKRESLMGLLRCRSGIDRLL